MDEIKIPIELPKRDFTNHIGIPGNHRIIFSGMFGMGKTYFLNKYFEEKKDQYNAIHLYPVNYSVSSNEDIFEYIKYDIASQLLLNKDIKFGSSEINELIHSINFLSSKPADILSPLLKFFPIIGDAA